MNNCVGERNYGSFSAFLFSIMGLIFSTLVSLILLASASGEKNEDEGGQPSNEIGAATIVALVVIGLFSVVMCFILGSFSIYHCFLICTGQTTRENLKKRSGKDYGRGAGGTNGRTLSCLCCRPASQINVRQWIDLDGEQPPSSKKGGQKSAQSNGHVLVTTQVAEQSPAMTSSPIGNDNV